MRSLNHIIKEFPVVKLIERHYRFAADELLKLAERNADFSQISFNYTVNWETQLIKKLEEHLDWYVFSANPGVTWETVAPLYAHKLDWFNAFKNPAFAWKAEYLEYQGTTDIWHYISIANLPFTDELIEKYKDYWDWNNLSMNDYIPWSEELLERYKDSWNWGYLSWNKSIPFTTALLEKYKNRWDFGSMCMNEKLVTDEWLPVLESYEKLNYDFISYYKKDITLEFLSANEDKLNWYELSANESLPWSSDLLQRFAHRWHYLEMSANDKVPWTEKLIEAHKEEWNWDGEKPANLAAVFPFSTNAGLPWSFDLVERYKDRWYWGKMEYLPEENYTIACDGITGIKSLEWTLEKMEKYVDRFDMEYILNNPNFYKAIENEVGRENIFKLYMSL